MRPGPLWRGQRHDSRLLESIVSFFHRHTLPLLHWHFSKVKGQGLEGSLYSPHLLSYSYEITVEHNGRLMFHLLATSNSKRKWDGIYDPSGNQWGLEMFGNCDALNYLNTIQPQYGWIGLSRPGRRTRKERGGGWCFAGRPGGADRCADAEYWESTFRDYGQCNAWPNPPLCNNFVRCVNVNGVKTYGST